MPSALKLMDIPYVFEIFEIKVSVKQVHHQQIALIPEYKSTFICCGYCSQPNLRVSNTYTCILLLYHLSIISDKIYNASMLLKHQYLVILKLCYSYYNTRQLLKSAASKHLEIVKSLGV